MKHWIASNQNNPFIVSCTFKDVAAVWEGAVTSCGGTDKGTRESCTGGERQTCWGGYIDITWERQTDRQTSRLTDRQLDESWRNTEKRTRKSRTSRERQACWGQCIGVTGQTDRKTSRMSDCHKLTNCRQERKKRLRKQKKTNMLRSVCWFYTGSRHTDRQTDRQTNTGWWSADWRVRKISTDKKGRWHGEVSTIQSQQAEKQADIDWQNADKTTFWVQYINIILHETIRQTNRQTNNQTNKQIDNKKDRLIHAT